MKLSNGAKVDEFCAQKNQNNLFVEEKNKMAARARLSWVENTKGSASASAAAGDLHQLPLADLSRPRFRASWLESFMTLDLR